MRSMRWVHSDHLGLVWFSWHMSEISRYISCELLYSPEEYQTSFRVRFGVGVAYVGLGKEAPCASPVPHLPIYSIYTPSIFVARLSG